MNRGVALAFAALAAGGLGLTCGDQGPVAGILHVHLVPQSIPGIGGEGAVLFYLTGPRPPTAARAPAGFRLFTDTLGRDTTKFIVTGPLAAGPILEIGVENMRDVGSYVATVHQLAGLDYQVRNPQSYTLTITR